MDGDEHYPPDLVPAQDATNTPDSGKQRQEAGAVPVTIVTGFLGAGKTTLLNYILTQEHGRRIAVIENEIGDSMDIESLIAKDGVDGSTLVGNLYELKNGCICCTVKDDLVSTLETLLERKSQFDYVIIETTGLANPGPVAAIFWLDDALESALRLDAIITLVDAKNIRRHLMQAGEHRNEAAMQVAYADRILVNKTDLVSEEDLKDVVSRIRAVNATADMRTAHRSTVDLSWILDIRCFSPEAASALNTSLLPASASTGQGQGFERPCPGSDDMVDNGHSHAQSSGGLTPIHEDNCAACAAASTEGGQKQGACSLHDPDVTTYTVELPGSVELAGLERWLGSLLWDTSSCAAEMFRIKGVVSIVGEENRFVVQGVADLFEVTPALSEGGRWREDEARRCKLVFIGRHLNGAELEKGVRSCAAQASPA